MINYYEILQLNNNASKNEIEKRIIELQRKWLGRINAPDFNYRQEAERMIKLLEEAQSILLDVSKRVEYDRLLENDRQLNVNYTEADSVDYLVLYNKKKYIAFQKEIVRIIQNGELFKADNILSEAVKQCPDHPGIYYLKGLLYYCNKGYSKATSFLNQAVYYDSNKVDYWCLLGRCKDKLNDYSGASEALEKAYNIDPNHVQTLVALSYLKLKMNDLDDALKFAEKARNYDNNNYDVLRLISKCYINSNVAPEKVLEALKSAKEIGTDSELDFDIAKFMYLCGYYDECLKYCKKIVVKNPNAESADNARQLIAKIKNKTVRKSSVNKTANNAVNNKSKRDTKSLEEALDKLNVLVGMVGVKKEIQRIVRLIEYEKMRRARLGLPEDRRLCYHFTFNGNPGTGKTTVARLIGDIFFHLGLLKEGHLVEVDRSKLVGQYIGQTAILTQEAIKSAIGGILFVDEAYALARAETGNDFGREAIETLLKAMEDLRGQFTVILAGYTNEMRDLMKMNPGLKSRINIRINFPNYSDDELLLIAKMFAEESYYELSTEAEKVFLERIYRENIDDHFANARTVRNIIEEAIREKAFRMAGKHATKQELCMLEPIDFGIKDFCHRDDMLKAAIYELEDMIGLREVKDKVYQIKDYVLTEIKRKEAGLKTKPIVLHMQFLGNPGTGKTTVARIVGKIFKAMGVLKRGHMVEVSRADLVGSYIGQTAPKTLNKIKEAYGGVLFIDEAYSICQGSENDFGHEALATLIKEMEDCKDKLMVILAGYPKEMERLLNINPGLKDRIRFSIFFPDYTPGDMVLIFEKMCEKNDYIINQQSREQLLKVFEVLYERRDRNFGNGRLVEKFFEVTKIIQAKRINRDNISGNDLRIILEEDIKLEVNL